MKILCFYERSVVFNADKIISVSLKHNDKKGFYIFFKLEKDHFYYYCSSEKSAKDLFSSICAFLTEDVPQNYFIFDKESDFND